MQLFDCASLVLALVVTGFLCKSMPIPAWLKALAVASAVAAVVHLGVEGFRWQMVPAYLVVALTLVRVCLRSRALEPLGQEGWTRRLRRWSAGSLAGLLLLLSLALSYAFPVFEVPAPRGSYAVGTMELHVVDVLRDERYTADPADRRELMLRVWYPAEAITDEVRAMYWREPRVRSRAVTHGTPLPWFTFSHLGLIPTHSFRHAPIASGERTYPVVIYSHGIGIGWASANTRLVEGLASRGYVVVGINHAFIGSISAYPDGRVVTFDEATGRAMNQPPAQGVLDLQAKLRASDDWREHIALYEQAMALMPEALDKVTTALTTQVEDQQFVISHLKQLQAGGRGPLAGRLDLERIGVIGMSLGGSAALETCAVDARCKAGVNLDGFHPRHIDLALQNTPFLFVNRADNLLYRTNFTRAASPVYSALVTGVTHFNFFDFSIMSPLYKRLGVLGPMDGERALNLTEDYVLTFFDEHLRGGSGTGFASLGGVYPEVEFGQRNSQSPGPP